MRKITPVLILLIFWMNFYILNVTGQLNLTNQIKSQYSDFQDSCNHMTATNSQQYSPHDPIIISSNSEFASQGFSGTGTVVDPYQLEGFNITATKSELIVIRHTTAHFTIRNGILDGMSKASIGISLFNVVNGTIENNLIVNHESYGIGLELSGYNIIANNTMTNNLNGIRLGSEGNNNNITDNTISNNKLNGIISEASTCILISNVVTGNQQGGIWLSGSDESVISANLIFNNSLQGIAIFNSNAVTLSNNTVLNNGYAGIEISVSQQIQVYSNTISNNGHEGLILSEASYSIVLNNTITNNSGYGVHLDELTQNVSISGNIFIGNNPNGESQACDEGQENIFETNSWDDWTNTKLPYPIEGIENPQLDSQPKSPFIINTNTIFGLIFLVIVVSALVVIIRAKQ